MISRITLRILFGGLVLFRLRLHCILIVFDIENLVPSMFQFLIFAILIFAQFLYYILIKTSIQEVNKNIVRWPSGLYCAKTWSLRKENLRRIKALEIRIWSRMQCIS